MSKKIDQRLPQNSGENSGLNQYYAIKTPWEKLIGYKEAMHYANRFEAVLSTAIMQAYRILIPDYEERTELMCKTVMDWQYEKSIMYGLTRDYQLNMHPFMCGQFTGALVGDEGDDCLLMCGRVQDFGTYRAEKELDACPWDICGTELCRATTRSLQGQANGAATRRRPGPTMDYAMVEARGAGDRHCRIVAESREKYPMPERKLWEAFGPIATADQIKYTVEEDCCDEPMVFREECDYKFINGTCSVDESAAVNMVKMSTAGSLYLLPAIEAGIEKGLFSREFAYHVVSLCCEGAGKAMFGEHYSIQACRDYLGVPNSIGKDGRILGGLIELQLQSVFCPYEVEAFNENEVIYVIDRKGLQLVSAKTLPDCHFWLWKGAVKTLVDAQWMVWEEDSPAGKMRIKIAKKIDKFQ